jgi:predicted transcriptional regulator
MKVAARKVIKARKDYHTLIRIVRQNPGIHYRELLRASGLSYGTLERQLALLERLGLIKAHRVVSFDEKRGYIVNNKPAIKRLLSKHKV